MGGGAIYKMYPDPDAMSGIWSPITELSDRERTHGTHAGLLLCAPELVDLDCNEHGVGLGHWQDDGLLWNMSQKECDERDPDKDYACWLACRWDMSGDEWRHVPCTPTHFIRLRGPKA